MPNQTARQQARRAALDAQTRMRQARAEQERRRSALAVTVVKALAERELLLKSAPHIMWPLRFVMPHDPGIRPVWMIRAGLFLYDHLARREVLPGSTTVDLRTHAAGAPLAAMARLVSSKSLYLPVPTSKREE